jgi:hypothetical protein
MSKEPEPLTCEHEWESNTAMTEMRCEKCGVEAPRKPRASLAPKGVPMDSPSADELNRYFASHHAAPQAEPDRSDLRHEEEARGIVSRAWDRAPHLELESVLIQEIASRLSAAEARGAASVGGIIELLRAECEAAVNFASWASADGLIHEHVVRFKADKADYGAARAARIAAEQ